MLTNPVTFAGTMPTIPNKRRKTQLPKKPMAERKNPAAFDYNKAAWRRNRAAHLQINKRTGKAGVLCELCLKKDPPRYVTAKVSDHIRPINQGGDVWNWANRQALCETCHNQKSGREGHSYLNNYE